MASNKNLAFWSVLVHAQWHQPHTLLVSDAGESHSCSLIGLYLILAYILSASSFTTGSDIGLAREGLSFS